MSQEALDFDASDGDEDELILRTYGGGDGLVGGSVRTALFEQTCALEQQMRQMLVLDNAATCVQANARGRASRRGLAGCTPAMAPAPLIFIRLAPGTLLGFKAAPGLPEQGRLPAIERGAHDGPSDWAAIYPQLDIAAAANYLPNQWDRGEAEAHIAALVCEEELSVAVLRDARLSEGSYPEADKASLVRQAFANAGLSLAPAAPLMDAVGEHSVCLLARDADGHELILPHAMWRHSALSALPLYSFSQSARIPGTTSRAAAVQPDTAALCLSREDLADPAQLGRALAAHARERGAVTWVRTQLVGFDD